MIYNVFNYPQFWIIAMGVSVFLVVMAIITAALIIKSAINKQTAVINQWVNLMTPSRLPRIPINNDFLTRK